MGLRLSLVGLDGYPMIGYISQARVRVRTKCHNS